MQSVAPVYKAPSFLPTWVYRLKDIVPKPNDMEGYHAGMKDHYLDMIIQANGKVEGKGKDPVKGDYVIQGTCPDLGTISFEVKYASGQKELFKGSNNLSWQIFFSGEWTDGKIKKSLNLKMNQAICYSSATYNAMELKLFPPAPTLKSWKTDQQIETPFRIHVGKANAQGISEIYGLRHLTNGTGEEAKKPAGTCNTYAIVRGTAKKVNDMNITFEIQEFVVPTGKFLMKSKGKLTYQPFAEKQNIGTCHIDGSATHNGVEWVFLYAANRECGAF